MKAKVNAAVPATTPGGKFADAVARSVIGAAKFRKRAGWSPPPKQNWVVNSDWDFVRAPSKGEYGATWSKSEDEVQQFKDRLSELVASGHLDQEIADLIVPVPYSVEAVEACHPRHWKPDPASK